MGNMLLAAATSTPSKSSGNAGLSYLIVIVLLGVFYFVIFRPQRRRRQQAASMQNTVEPGANVRTTAGIYGTVVSVDDVDVVVQIAPGVEIRMLRRAIMEVLPDDADNPPSAQSPSPGAEDADRPGGAKDDLGADDVHDDVRSDEKDSGDRNF
ncbi:MAG TPA: preprotein translocase subunit YajC [Streptosporangiaceae bacterium]|jgi:preprotein translocase subunit YajC